MGLDHADLNDADREMVKAITQLGIRASVLLRGVVLQKVDEETLKWGLQELAAGDLIGTAAPSAISDRAQCSADE